MSPNWGWLRTTVRALAGAEAYLFLAYASLPLRPGAIPPPLPAHDTVEVRPVPGDWTREECQLFIDEARIDAARQHADKLDIRARAQLVLTTAVVVGGLLTTSYGSKDGVCLAGCVLYAAAGLCVGLALLASAGIITARSDLGAVNVSALTHYETGELLHTVATGYAATRRTGAETVAVMVTVLRDSVSALVVGAALLAVAHLTV